MIIKLLGLIDVFAGISFWLFGVFGVMEEFLLLLGLILLCKGVVFGMGGDFISILDIIFGLIIIIGISIKLPIVIIIVVSLFLLQKGIFSLLG